jgi:MFS family permease
MAVSAFTIAAVPALWLIATNPWQAVALNIFAGLAWSGWNLGIFNMLLVLSPESRRQAYVAVANSTPAIAGMISPLIAGVLADMFGIRPLLAASAIGRLSAAVLFWFAVAETTGARGQKATEPGGRGG